MNCDIILQSGSCLENKVNESKQSGYTTMQIIGIAFSIMAIAIILAVWLYLQNQNSS